MLEAYSQNVTVNSNTYIPFTNVAVAKGGSAELNGSSTIKFNKCGLYLVTFSGSAIAGTVGTIEVQLMKNGLPVTQAVARESALDITSSHSFSFTTTVQVPSANLCKCCTAPTTIGVLNDGVDAEYSIADIVVTRIC